MLIRLLSPQPNPSNNLQFMEDANLLDEEKISVFIKLTDQSRSLQNPALDLKNG